MDPVKADKRIRNAWVAGVLSIFVCITTMILTHFVNFVTIYSPRPWILAYSAIEFILWLLIVIIIAGVYKRFKMAAFFLFVFYSLDKLIALIFVMENWNIFEIIYWVAISFLFGYFFYQGVRGAFAHRKSKVKAS
jgi:hypothetical protein